MQAAGERGRARETEQIHIKDEEDRRHREEERRRMEQAPPHQPQGGPPLHQPVAVGPPRAHGPNGILNAGMAGQHPQPQPQLPLGAPSGPGNIFAGGPVQQQPHQPHQMQPGLLMPPFAQGAQQQPAQQMSQGGHGQGQGQQPILNDALSYLDQVKVQFADHPDVYNRFLDIMKDFKSGAIDTPGVIGRVSTLFAGNPDLIQGFNTFLPPGYRIECGADNDPNAIRVTTPMGTTVSSMPQPRPLSRMLADSRRAELDGESGRAANGTYTPQPGGGQSAEMMFSPSGRPVGPAAPGQQQHLSPLDAARQEQQQAMHAQEQRGVNSLQNAVSAATGAGGLRAGISPRATPMPGQGVEAGAVDGSAGADKRGPVEFNHAISYVNKIKNRFSAQPDIYKQFLEILQTYQRESKPIQDVYGQVTRLFNVAPDLLEDFKQFLPESAAHAKAVERARQQAEENAMMSHVRGETRETYASPVMSREAHMGTPSHGRGLPPVGNFAPTPVAKDNKKRKPERQGTADSIAGPSGSKASYGGPQGKRQKQTHPPAKGPSDQAPASPSLVPALPAPLPPTTTTAATHDEMNFFDKVKKAIGNKNTMTEFLKLCNLYTQDFMDSATFLYRAHSFIGGNPDLMKFLEDFVHPDSKSRNIDLKPRIPTGRVSLSNCRGLGPSYRLLPKRERQKPCSGRDELCNAVLNDEWASHPTWASEDSGFIAHRKNTFEEALHRIEEERHDYDFNIEACARTIQLLEPIAQQLRRSTDMEQRAYQLPPGLGGQSQTIYKRIIMKVYGREKGHEVVEHLHQQPYQVIPVLLNRLKERLETWKMAQREWEKVWRDQTQKMFWKSLDHQHVSGASKDKKQFQTKALQTEIAVKHEEMRRLELNVPGTMKKPQMIFKVEDLDVVVDVTHLLLLQVRSVEAEQPRLTGFLQEFVPLFFGVDPELFRAKVALRGSGNATPMHEIGLADEPMSGGEEGAIRGRAKGKSNTLLRSALDPSARGRKMARGQREESHVSASRASSPAMSNAGDGAEDMAIDAPATDPANTNNENADAASPSVETATKKWFQHPDTGNLLDNRQIDPNEPQKRETYRMWASTPIYCFMRMLLNFYERLHKLKVSEIAAAETISHAMKHKPAVDIGIVDKLPTDFFLDLDSTAAATAGSNFYFYTQMLSKFEAVLLGDMDFSPDVEDALRRYYLQSGYVLYPLEKLVQQTVRFAASVLNGEGKEKSFDIYNLFKRDRVRDTTTVPQQTDYRKAVEKMVRDGDLYRIDYDQQRQSISFYLVKKDDPAHYDDGMSPLDREMRWREYIASYQRVDATDSVPPYYGIPFLSRNLKAMGANPKSSSYPPSPPAEVEGMEAETLRRGVLGRVLGASNEEKQVVRIAVDSYRILFEPKSFESWIQPLSVRAEGTDGIVEAGEMAVEREETVKEKYVLANEAMCKGMSKDDVERASEKFLKLAEDGVEFADRIGDHGEAGATTAGLGTTSGGGKQDEGEGEKSGAEGAKGGTAAHTNEGEGEEMEVDQ
ncbi:hypothetical protein EJ03DRAFT_339985 [Teratosphaeria nubilosa]|uniref:Histone deacetylase interacting domain-containing protein n=1 Tax=Teratosphaeria nubilosa TaxID=161662 RepID=A0A6G1KUT8_9PEZI|nr:hypothetical protein EJ03DRAFT_339985 [Teratosphaeria nubilosa]